MKRLMIILLAMMLIVMTFASCSKKETPADESTDQTTEQVEDLDEEYSDVYYEEEDDEASIEKVDSAVDKFYGTWVAKSGRAEFLYGGVELTVKKDGTWTGIITEEDFSGTWKKNDGGIHMNNADFSFDLAFSSTGKLVMIESNEDGDITTVLTKK